MRNNSPFKACVRYFLSNFYFSPNYSPSKLWNMIFFLHLKRLFPSQNIQIFVFLSSPLFLSVSHCFRGWSKINLWRHNCRNKNLATHFVWYLEKEKRYDIKSLSIGTLSYKEHFYGKVMQKMHKASPRSIFDFGK